MFFVPLTFSFAWYLISFLLIYVFFRSKTKRKSLVLIGLYFLLNAIVISLGVYWENRLLAFGGSFLAVGLFVLAIGIYQWQEIRRFRKMVKAEYVGYNTYPAFKDVVTYKVLFRYVLDGTEYISESRTGYSNLGFQHSYKTGQRYNVYIDEQNYARITERIADPKKVNTMFFLGIACILLFFFFLSYKI